MIPMLLGLAIPLIKAIAGKFMDEGLSLASSAITGGGKRAKEFIEEKTGIKLDDPVSLTSHEISQIRELEANPVAAFELKKLSLEILEEENRHEETIDRNWGELIAQLSKADSTGSSTRPMIARMMAYMIGFAVIIFTTALAYAIFNDATDTLKQLNDSWPLMLAILATPTALLRSYFGMRTKEKKARYQLMSDYEMEPSIVKDALSILKK